MRIPQSTIDQIIDRADIVEVIGEYVKLEKKGNDYKGICPFHNDSNPSLSVSPNKKIYKCFSCNEAGNVVRFVEKIKNVSFFESIKLLAEKYNIKLDIEENSQAERYKKYYNIMKDATNSYEFYLMNTKEGEKALEYLHNRQLNDDIIRRFNIGLSSGENNVICKTLLESEKYLPLDLKELRLIDNKNGKYYDVFSSRIIFPIKDLKGNFVGYSGRAFPSGNPKYINTPDNPIFKKGNILYNFSDAINDIKNKNCVYLFEGFMDVIAAYKCGVTNSVATMGTALTEFQIQALKKVTDNVVICFDSDGPGVDATKRAIKMFTEAGFHVKTILLDGAKDSDEYACNNGLDALYNVLNNQTLSAIDYLYKICLIKLNINDPNSIALFQKDVYAFLKYFNSKSLESYIFNKMSKDLNLSNEDLKKDFETNKEKSIAKDDYNKVSVRENDRTIVLSNRKKNKYLRAEKVLVYLAYNSKDDCMFIRNNLGFRSYVNKTNRDILYKLYDYYSLSDTMNSNDFFKKLTDDEKAILTELLNSQNVFMAQEKEELIDTVIAFQYEKNSDEIIEKFNTKNEATEDDVINLVANKKRTIKIKKIKN